MNAWIPERVVVVSIPLFVIVARLGWQDTYQGLILLILANGAFGTFMFRQFFLSAPEELGDAATVDSANHLDIFARIYLPLSKPALMACGIITAMTGLKG
jgi:multiple sugar transport system permease protein